MITITATLPTATLPIRRVLAELTQAYLYTQLPQSEHEGHAHVNGKVFKSMNFKVLYKDCNVTIGFSAIRKSYEKEIAMAVLREGLKLGEIHIAQTEIALNEKYPESLQSGKIKVKGYVAAAIKDGNSNKKIYLEPKTHKFQEIVHKHTLEKYETLMRKPYQRDLNITPLYQAPKPRTFYYKRARIRSWYGVYEIEANEEMLRLILDTGLGAHAMQGLGFVEVLEEG